ncbi:MAG: rhodanese-like domain-containing protein [Paenibacillaceae bacterium]|nr:rhodanese-like domain-containing protein [Paenibacillaceae bacterium]
MAQLIEDVSHVTAQELRGLLADPDSRTLVVDVREPEEYVAAHIPGVPLIPMGDIVDLIDRFDKEREFVLVCRSGRRSLEVAKFFAANGIGRVHNFLGGMLDWQEQGYEVEDGPGLSGEAVMPETLTRGNNR